MASTEPETQSATAVQSLETEKRMKWDEEAWDERKQTHTTQTDTDRHRCTKYRLHRSPTRVMAQCGRCIVVLYCHVLLHRRHPQDTSRGPDAVAESLEAVMEQSSLAGQDAFMRWSLWTLNLLFESCWPFLNLLKKIEYFRNMKQKQQPPNSIVNDSPRGCKWRYPDKETEVQRGGRVPDGSFAWVRQCLDSFHHPFGCIVRLYKMCEGGYSDLMKRRPSARAKCAVVWVVCWSGVECYLCMPRLGKRCLRVMSCLSHLRI